MLLLGAGALEVLMAVALRESQSWTRVLPSVLGVVFALASIFLLAAALRGIPLASAYVVWTGIGAIGVALVGVLYYREVFSWTRLACMLLVVAGTAGLRATEG
jgi:quaternary ammonium compound-resistance protein SugE